MKKIYVYVIDTMADWELSYVMPAIQQGISSDQGASGYEIVTVGRDKQPIQTAGGLRVIPDCSLDEMIDEQAAALILPGADTWASSDHQLIIAKAVRYLEEDILVAGICGATLGLANAGVLDHYQHTSSALEFLTEFSTSYHGIASYQHQLSVVDRNLITASPAGALDFARDILDYLEILPEPVLKAWYNYYRTGDKAYYFELLNL